jgi:hypothetical protein
VAVPKLKFPYAGKKARLPGETIVGTKACSLFVRGRAPQGTVQASAGVSAGAAPEGTHKLWFRLAFRADFSRPGGQIEMEDSHEVAC